MAIETYKTDFFKSGKKCPDVFTSKINVKGPTVITIIAVREFSRI